MLEKPEESGKIDGEIGLLKEEVRNIQNAIEENESIKKTISTSLEVRKVFFT